MKFSFSSEQEEFRSNLRRFLGERSPTKEVRRLMATDAGFEAAAWRKLNSELGLTAVRIPEAYGGQGFGFGELCIVLEEMGRSLLCAPFFSTAVLADRRDPECRHGSREAGAAARHRRRRYGRHAGLGRAAVPLGCRRPRP